METPDFSAAGVSPGRARGGRAERNGRGPTSEGSAGSPPAARARGGQRRARADRPGVRNHLVANVDGDPWPVRVRNISAGGVSLFTSRPLELESEVAVDLFNRATGFDGRIPARVVFVLPHPCGDHAVGLAFARPLTAEEVEGLL